MTWFEKNIIKQIKKCDRYRLRKREIGAIKGIVITYMDTKVLRSDVEAYCERSDFNCEINHKFSCTVRIFSNGTIEVFD